MLNGSWFEIEWSLNWDCMEIELRLKWVWIKIEWRFHRDWMDPALGLNGGWLKIEMSLNRHWIGIERRLNGDWIEIGSKFNRDWLEQAMAAAAADRHRQMRYLKSDKCVDQNVLCFYFFYSTATNAMIINLELLLQLQLQD